MFGTKMLRSLKIGFVILFLHVGFVSAQDITAIDFSGEIIGKVIPDGTAINLNNEIIGQLTADSFIVNGRGRILGGIVPQGFAVSNDHKYLGKVSSDGMVRLPSGRVAGKVLPNGLVVDDLYEVIGGVLSSGIVYNDEGKPVGRLAGNGAYIDFEGRNLGFVSSTGYAYRQRENDFVVEGRLISSKMVVSLDGVFIGSVAPGGQVTDFDGAFIGKVHANGYVYDDKRKIIGQIVRSAYAFDNKGSYMGLVSYNGDVILDGKTVGKLKSNGRIADLKGEVVGFSIDLNSVAISGDGKYLGYVIPGGQVVKSRGEVVGFVAAGRMVKDKSGRVIGEIASKGPIFDYLGKLKAEAVLNGLIVSFEGSNLGFMKGRFGFDNAGFMIGSILGSALILDANEKVIGLTGVGTDVSFGAHKFKVSPLGYVYSEDNVLAGQLMSFAPIYKENGDLLGFVDVNGKVEATGGDGFKLRNSGLILNDQNQIEGSQIDASYVALYGSVKQVVSENNVVYSEGKPVSKIVPEYKLVPEGKGDVMPVMGDAGKKSYAVLNVRGELQGYADMGGHVLSADKEIGRLINDGMVLNKKGVYLGQVMPFGAVVNSNCENLGVVGVRGDVRSGRDNVLGKLLLNGQVVSEVGQYLGYVSKTAPVYDFEGHFIGVSNGTGKVLDDEKQVVGCLSWNGRMYEDGSVFKGGAVDESSVMNFDSAFIGRVNLKNEFINKEGAVAGYATPDGTVLNENGRKFGLVFKYKVAFDRDNNFVGYVNSEGQVFDDKNVLFGQVMYDGLVVSKNKAVGYALYDLYVYNENNNVIGYLTKNGSVMSFSGVNLGKADRGFLVSREGELVGRGHRDYFVRDKKYGVVGELQLSGKVVDMKGNDIGKVSGNGDVRDQTGQLLAMARPLQYYVVEGRKGAEWLKKTEDETSQFKPSVATIDVAEPSDIDLPSYSQKVIGVVVSPDGKYLGKLLETGDVISDEGDVIGKERDGLAFDGKGNLIGTIEVKEPGKSEQSAEPSGSSGQAPSTMFLPKDAYGISNVPSDLGPGGGFGPNERYDPVRSRMLAMAQAERQRSITVGKLTSEVNPSTVTGWQSNWDNANYTISSWRVDMSEMILADKPIPAVLARTIMESGIASDIPITAIVERNVYAEDGRNIVIPAGSRVMGQSSGGSTGGTTGGAVRVDITWTRLIRPDGSAFEFSQAKTGDAQGRGGALGYLDEQLLKKYTLPMMTSLTSDALAYVMARGQTTTSSDGTTTQDSRAQAAEDARQHFLDHMNEIFNDILQDKMRIQAVTYVPAGTRLIIYPKVDLWLRTAEREREQETSKMALGKPEKLIDDTDPLAPTRGSGRSSSGGGGSSVSRTSTNGSTTVVYGGDDRSVEPASAPLLDDGSYARKRRRAVAPGVTPPPPSTNATTGTSSSSDSSSGALF